MFRRLRSFIGLNSKSVTSSKRLVAARRGEALGEPAMLDLVKEIAIYIHRFHNLDLFQQGWYQIKVSMRWEDDSHNYSIGTPSRVVQYEAPDLISDDTCGIWRIDDVDNSFSTQPFHIKYARQDVLLSMMISFNFAIDKFEIPLASAIILKFELLYSPIPENGSGLHVSFDASPAAVHEFRIPPKALLGLHSYCPVQFDTIHAVLVDVSIHVTLLRSVSYRPLKKVFSDSGEQVSADHHAGHDQSLDQKSCEDLKDITLIKALITARDILFEELQKLGKVVDQTIDDMIDVNSTSEANKLIDSQLWPIVSNKDAKASDVTAGGRELASESCNGLEKSNGIVDFRTDGILQSVSREDVSNAFSSLGNQLSVIWNAFLTFHRSNRTKIIEHLHDVWANERKVEWSIWMVQSNIDVPHCYLSCGADGASHQSTIGTVSLQRKANEDPIQVASTRAEVLRRSIALMNIDNQSIQDMNIFGDPSHVPVVLIEHHVKDAPLWPSSCNSPMDSLDNDGFSAASFQPGLMVGSLGTGTLRTGRVLRVVIFVHGFQGHHLDLRLIRNQWLLIDPGADCLMSEANEDKTSGDLGEMGARLAEEVSTFLRKKIDKALRYGGCRDIRLSFVGHSIGNIIIRTALTESSMESYLRYLYTYMSVSGPHLGYLYSSNSLFNSGLWLLKKLKGAQCFHQLTFTDDPDLQNTFIYKLCKQKTLEHFKHIIVLSSPQDGYVPYHSARFDLCPAAIFDRSKRGSVFMEMLNNCLDQIRAPSSEKRTFMRCDVNFDTSSQGRNLNTFIGRAAHIEFLESDEFAKFVMWSFTELFR